jgi:hypothetical protein
MGAAPTPESPVRACARNYTGAMRRGRRAGIAAALAIAAAGAITAGCGGGSSALALDPVAAAATKTQDAGAARIRFALAVKSPQLHGKTLRLRGAGAIDGSSEKLTLDMGSIFRLAGIPPGISGSATMGQLEHAKVKEIVLEQNGDYVLYLGLGALSSYLPGGKPWIELDLSKLGKAAGLDLGKLLSGTQFQPSDLLSMLEAEGATISNLGSATVDGAATTHYRVKIDLAKALQAKGLTGPLLAAEAAQIGPVYENVWIGKDGLVRRIRLSYRFARTRAAMTMDIYDYGAHVTIAPPSSSAVFDATQLAQQGLGSAFTG